MSVNIENIKHRSVIEFLVKEGRKPNEIHERMNAVYGDTAPSYATVKRWAAMFKQGRDSLEDDPRPGRSVDVTTEEMCSKVEEFVLENRRVTVSRIAMEMGISVGSTEKILHEKLGMSKVCARWVPRMLTPEMKKQRVRCSQAILDMINADEDKFYSRLVTGDETWIHHYDPETKKESMVWKHSGSPPPKKFKVQKSAGKMLATIFWDEEGPLLIDYMPHNTTITGAYDATLLTQLREAIKKKRRGKLSRKVLLLHDNAPVHTAHISETAIKECGFQLLPHPPYSPDLAPSDFFLFQQLKKNMRGSHYADDDDVRCAVQTWFDGCEKSFFSDGIRGLTNRITKCIAIQGTYVEK